jgi:hypothetical protein
MAYLTYRVEIIRDETRAAGGVSIDITAYIDRMPETEAAGVAMLVRVPASVWNTRLLYSGDFETLAEALAAIEARHPEITSIRCFEHPLDYEYPLDMAPLQRSADGWAPGAPPAAGPPPQLDWRVG